jgi:hypothetical protein
VLFHILAVGALQHVAAAALSRILAKSANAENLRFLPSFLLSFLFNKSEPKLCQAGCQCNDEF